MLTCRCRWEWSGSQRPGFGVEVELLGLLLAVGAALPGEHRPSEPRRPGRRAGRAKAGETVVQQRGGQDRPLEVEEREDEHLVPEDVAPVGLPVPAAGRNADIQMDAMGGDGLQQVEDVQVQDRLGPLVRAVQLDVEPVPEAIPRPLMAGHQSREARRRPGRLPRVQQALGGYAVPGGVQGDDLLHRRRVALLQLEGELVGDEPGLGDQPPLSLGGLAVAQQPGAGGQRDPDVGLGCLDLQVDGLVVDLAGVSTSGGGRSGRGSA